MRKLVPPEAFVGRAEDMGQSSKLNHPLKMSTTPKDRGIWLEVEAPSASPDSPQSGSEQALSRRHQQTFMKLHWGEKFMQSP